MKESVTPRRTAAKSLRLLKLVVRTLDDKKAEDLRVLEVSRQSSITDYLVLATGTSEPHLRALRAELEEVLDEAKVPVIGIESTQGSGWTVLDAFEVMVHLFTAENRAKYRLEMLWKDAVVMTVTRLLARSQAAGERTESAPTAKLREKTA
jgi:ribosome-associated protein